MYKYASWEDAKRGKICRKLFVKLHILTVVGGVIAACNITHGNRHDSPVFRNELIQRVPDGTGDVVLDAAYDARDNYRVIVDSGRKPVIRPRDNAVAKGFNPRAAAIRGYREDPDAFAEDYGQRSLVEAVFSSMKRGFGHHVAAKKFVMQQLSLVLRVICYNFTA